MSKTEWRNKHRESKLDAKDVRVAKKRISEVAKDPSKLVSGAELNKRIATIEGALPPQKRKASKPVDQSAKFTKEQEDAELKRLMDEMQDRVCGAMHRRGWTVKGLFRSVEAIERIMQGDPDVNVDDMAAVSLILNTRFMMVANLQVREIPPAKPNEKR